MIDKSYSLLLADSNLLCQVVTKNQRPPLSALPAGTPEEVRAVIEEGWTADRSARLTAWQSCVRLEAALQALQQAAVVAGPHQLPGPPPSVAQVVPPPSQQPGPSASMLGPAVAPPPQRVLDQPTSERLVDPPMAGLQHLLLTPRSQAIQQAPAPAGALEAAPPAQVTHSSSRHRQSSLPRTCWCPRGSRVRPDNSL